MQNSEELERFFQCACTLHWNMRQHPYNIISSNTLSFYFITLAQIKQGIQFSSDILI